MRPCRSPYSNVRCQLVQRFFVRAFNPQNRLTVIMGSGFASRNSFVTGDTARTARCRRSRSRPRSSAKQCHCGATRRSRRAHMTAFWHCKRHSDGVVMRSHTAKAGATRTKGDSAQVPDAKLVVSHVTGYDRVTRFRDFETIPARFRATRGRTASRGWAVLDGGEIAKSLCLLAEMHKTRRLMATGLVLDRDGSQGPVDWRRRESNPRTPPYSTRTYGKVLPRSRKNRAETGRF